MKRSLSLLLSLVFCLSLASCKKPPQEQSNNQGGETPPEIIDNVCNMSTDSTYFKTHGRTSVVSEGLACDASASGIEFNAYIEGDLKITLNISQSAHLDEKHLTNESYFTLYIDGVRSEERIHGMMGEGRWSDIQPILNGQFKGEQGGIYTLAVPSDNSGGGGHPGLAAHASCSDTLAQFIKDKGLAN